MRTKKFYLCLREVCRLKYKFPINFQKFIKLMDKKSCRNNSSCLNHHNKVEEDLNSRIVATQKEQQAIKSSQATLRIEPFTQSGQKLRSNAESWEQKDIQKLFKLYNQYGSQWTLISSQFPHKFLLCLSRSPNSIKNRFYTTIRLCLKALYREVFKKKKIPREINSKNLLRLYESDEQFANPRGLLRFIMRQLNYQSHSPMLDKIVVDQASEIREMFTKIFDSQELDNSSSGDVIWKARSMEENPQGSQAKQEALSPKSQPDYHHQNFNYLSSSNAPQAHIQTGVPGPFIVGNFFWTTPQGGVFFPFGNNTNI